MTKKLHSAAFVLSFFLLSFLAEAQQVFKTTPTSVIPYLEYVPQDYNANSDKYPIVFFLHGIGERGPNSTDIATLQAGVWTITKNGPPKLVKNGQQFPFILISIQLKNNYGTWPTWYVLEVIDYVKTYLRIDERRVHITGLSMGGGGTWTMAEYYPELFATAGPVCGGYNATSKACAIAAENLPVWAFHGDADTVVPYSKTVNMVNAINGCTPKPNPLAKLTIYAGLNHNVWDRAYTTDNTYHTPNFYQWLMSYTNTVNKGNKIPVANACSDKTITTKTVSLTATATDADGTIASYAWTQISGAACTLSNASTSSLSVAGLATGKYTFKVTVTDNLGQKDSDYVNVLVDAAPVASAGADKSISLPTSATSVTGSGTDPDGTIASYKWTFVSGPKTPMLTNSATATVSASDMTVAGSYTLQLEVKDNLGGVGRDQMVINVLQSTSSSSPLGGAGNTAPTANAGKDLVLYLPSSSATLTGSGSDAQGNIVSYTWTQVSGPVHANMSGTTTPTLSASGMTVAGFYVFKLTVKDSGGLIAEDKAGVSVKSPVTASGGTALLIEEPSNVDLARDEDAYWEDKKVRVYSETGAEIYAGIWQSDSYETVLSRGGLFIYNVYQGNQKVYSGKLAVRQ